jgi:hypothetical protein
MIFAAMVAVLFSDDGAYVTDQTILGDGAPSGRTCG